MQEDKKRETSQQRGDVEVAEGKEKLGGNTSRFSSLPVVKNADGAEAGKEIKQENCRG